MKQRLIVRALCLGVACLVLWSGGGALAAEPSVGNPGGLSSVPVEARAEDTSRPDIVIGNGTPASCTSSAVVAAVAQGGVITFDCGPGSVTIEMFQTAKVVNNAGRKIVLDGGGKVTLSGRGEDASST